MFRIRKHTTKITVVPKTRKWVKCDFALSLQILR